MHLVREWDDTYDKRGIHICKYFRNMEKLFRFLREKVDWNDFPPPSKFIQGMPFQTYECLKQCISTRMQIFALSKLQSSKCQSSPFSVNTHMECNVLRCPRAMDIPRLISGVVDFNQKSIINVDHRNFLGMQQTEITYFQQVLHVTSDCPSFLQ